jgi:hypothetical protein
MGLTEEEAKNILRNDRGFNAEEEFEFWYRGLVRRLAQVKQGVVSFVTDRHPPDVPLGFYTNEEISKHINGKKVNHARR